jgi:trigger factor
MRPNAEEQVRGQLLLEAIATVEKVEVTEAEVSEHIARIASLRNVPPARLRAEYDRDDKLEGVRFQLRHDKTLDLLLNRAEISEGAPEEHVHDESCGHDHDHDHGPEGQPTEG